MGPWLALAHHPRYLHVHLPGFAYYHGVLVTSQGQLLPSPQPGPLVYIPWSDGIAAVLRRLHNHLPQARVVVTKLGDGGTDNHAHRTYLRQARAASFSSLALFLERPKSRLDRDRRKLCIAQKRVLPTC